MGTDVAARGLDIDDIDVVIQTGCRDMDSFVHRAGRTARKGKDGLNVLFISSSNLTNILRWEQKLNINLKVSNSIEGTLKSDDGTKHIDRLNKHMNGLINVDQNASQQILQTLTNPELPDGKLHDYIKFLVEFYVSKTTFNIEQYGLITGLLNSATYGLTDVKYP